MSRHAARLPQTWPTTTACPTWCDRAATEHPFHHGHEETTEGGQFHRVHQSRLADLPAWDMAVYLEQLETAHTPDGSTTLHPVTINLDVPDYAVVIRNSDRSPADQLRLIAATLQVAADRADQAVE